jgi:cephalosporin hydroxylase
MISVMNLTNRHGGIDILWASMKRQTEQDFQLVLVDGLCRERDNEVT